MKSQLLAIITDYLEGASLIVKIRSVVMTRLVKEAGVVHKDQPLLIILAVILIKDSFSVRRAISPFSPTISSFRDVTVP
jgi:hypothetical protein